MTTLAVRNSPTQHSPTRHSPTRPSATPTLASSVDRQVGPRTAGVSPELRRQAVTFVAISAVCTLAYYALYLVLRAELTAEAANIVAAVATTVASTAAHRRYTVNVTEPGTAGRHQLQMLAVFGFGLLLNSVGLAALAQVLTNPSTVAEMATLAVTGLGATALRIDLMRRWH